MKTRTHRRGVALAGALVVAALSTTGAAYASTGHGGNRVEQHSTSKVDSDQAAQDTACKAAGIDPNASNINYDDATGVCSLDQGGDQGQD